MITALPITSRWIGISGCVVVLYHYGWTEGGRSGWNPWECVCLN